MRALQRGLQQKRPREDRISTPAKRKLSQTICNHCGNKGHIEINCWRKSKKCFRCGSLDHQIRDCKEKSPEDIGTIVNTPASRRKSESASKLTVSAKKYALNKNKGKGKIEKK